MLKKCPKSSWQHYNFSVMFTTENEIIRNSWRQIYRLLVNLFETGTKLKIPSEVNPPLQYEFVVDQKHVINYAQEYQFKIFPFPKNHILSIENYIRVGTDQSLKPKNCSIIGFDIEFTRSFSKYHWCFFLPSCLVVCIAGTSFIIPPKGQLISEWKFGV